MTSVEDLESGANHGNPNEPDYNEDVELARIKGNYRTTVIVPELPATYPEAQFAFQELQNELQEFLGQYVPKVASVQAMLSSNVANGAPYDNRITARMSRMTKASHLIQNPDPDGGEPKDLDSQMNHDPMPSRNSSVKQRKTPVNKHMQSLQAFLMTHMDNLAALQTAISSGTEMHAKRSIVSHTGSPQNETDSRVEHGLSQQCRSVVVVSTATSILVFGVLTLAQTLLVTDNDPVAYDIAAMFALLALSFHFGIIILAGHGARRVARHSVGEKSKEDLRLSIGFYLTMCEQLQLLATLLLIVSVLVLSFLVFSTVAFSVVIVVICAMWALVVSGSAYWKVLITVENLLFLVKNLPRLGWRSVDYVRTNVKARAGQF